MGRTTLFLPIVVRPHEETKMVNWPPATFPPWPPPEMETTWASFSEIKILLRTLQGLGFSQSIPTSAERNQYFRDARCDENHTVIGRMLVSPDGTRRYPFAVCTGTERELLVLWPPYSCGFDSGRED